MADEPSRPEEIARQLDRRTAVALGSIGHPNSIARMYDFLMGGTRHVEKDRDVARDALAAAPMIKLTIWENRKLIKRVVRDEANAVAGGVGVLAGYLGGLALMRRVAR